MKSQSGHFKPLRRWILCEEIESAVEQSDTKPKGTSNLDVVLEPLVAVSREAALVAHEVLADRLLVDALQK